MLQIDRKQADYISKLHLDLPGWTAEAAEVNGRRVIAVRLTDGSLVYLDPDIAKRFAEQILAAVSS